MVQLPSLWCKGNKPLSFVKVYIDLYTYKYIYVCIYRHTHKILFSFLLYFFHYYLSPLNPLSPRAVICSPSISLSLFCLFIRVHMSEVYGVCLSLTGLFHLA